VGIQRKGGKGAFKESNRVKKSGEGGFGEGSSRENDNSTACQIQKERRKTKELLLELALGEEKRRSPRRKEGG